MFNEGKKDIILLILGFSIVTISVAYAALSTTLSISGRAGIPQTNWDIHFENFSTSLTPANTLSGATNTGTITSVTTSNTSIDNLRAELKKPGDSIVYSFDIVNNGTIDAKLASFNDSITCASDNTCSYATYSIECKDSNNNVVNTNFKLDQNSSINCKLSLKYNDNANIDDDVSATLSASWNFIQY